ncbi:MAG: DMT family transporter [Paracoccaceae bacterium]
MSLPSRESAETTLLPEILPATTGKTGGGILAISENTRGAVLMTVSMAAFTINDAFIKTATADLPLSQAIVIRGVMTTLALALIAARTGGLRLELGPTDRWRLGLRTVGEVMSTITFLLALQRMDFASLSAVMQVLPLAVTLAAFLFLGEPLGWRRILAIVVGFVGVLLILRPGADAFNLWSLMALIAVGFIVLRDLTTRRLSVGLPSTMVAFVSSAAVLMMGAFLSVFVDWQPVMLRHVLLLTGSASFLIVGYVAAVAAMRVGEIGVVAPFRYTALVFAIFLGWAAFGTAPDGWMLAGAAIVVGAGLFSFYRERQQSRQAAMR